MIQTHRQNHEDQEIKCKDSVGDVLNQVIGASTLKKRGHNVERNLEDRKDNADAVFLQGRKATAGS